MTAGMCLDAHGCWQASGFTLAIAQKQEGFCHVTVSLGQLQGGSWLPQSKQIREWEWEGSPRETTVYSYLISAVTPITSSRFYSLVLCNHIPPTLLVKDDTRECTGSWRQRLLNWSCVQIATIIFQILELLLNLLDTNQSKAPHYSWACQSLTPFYDFLLWFFQHFSLQVLFNFLASVFILFIGLLTLPRSFHLILTTDIIYLCVCISLKWTLLWTLLSTMY